MVFNFWQDHAFFYDRTVGNCVCKMKPKIPTIPTQKLYEQADEHDRILHNELVACHYDGMIAAIKREQHVTYPAPDLE